MYALYRLMAAIDTSGLPHHGSVGTADLNRILQIVFGLAASIALLIIVIAGFRYIVAAGDPEGVSRAKKAILYAVIGLLVSLAAFSIVTIVLQNIGTDNTANSSSSSSNGGGGGGTPMMRE